MLGVNAVLPTSNAARFTSPLNVHDFMKSYGVGYVTKAGYPELARQAHNLASYKGLMVTPGLYLRYETIS